MQIHQIAHYANDTTLEPEVREMYWKACRELSRVEQDLRLYASAQENYRKQLQMPNLSDNGREWIQDEYTKTSRIVWELKWRKIFLEAFTPCSFYFEPVEDVIAQRSTSVRMSREEEKLGAARKLRETLEQLAEGEINFDEAHLILKKYYPSQN